MKIESDLEYFQGYLRESSDDWLEHFVGLGMKLEIPKDIVFQTINANTVYLITKCAQLLSEEDK